MTWLEAPAAPWPGGFPAPSDLAHLYFTSGTTGRPKGVMLTHKNVAEHARQAIAELGLRPADGWGHFAPMFHLADAWATFAATAAGARHHFLERFEADAALQQLQDEAITLSNLVPTMLQRMLALPRPAGEWNRLRLVLSGGAPIAPSLVQRIMDFFGCEYAQTYGLTETSPYLTFSLPRPGERHPEGPAGIARRARTGRAFGRVGLRVVDEAGIDVPQDDRAVGEIWASGPTVTPGYWRDADATAAAFAGEWFRTGDLATWDATGSVNIVDRKKDMILTGGENVYSIEVEAALLAHPGVLEAAAFGVPDADWGEAVWAAVVWAPGATADLERLQQHLHAQLAGYKCPKRILECPELPKTSSGKIQKRLLRESLRPGGTLAP
ncbi:MAG: AMP-binding protein [Planctomycetota bacterium]